MHMIQKFQATVAGIGLGNAVLYAVSRLLTAVFGTRARIVKYYFTAQPIPARDTAQTLRTGIFSIAPASLESPLFTQVERPPEIIAARFRQGAHCLAAVADGDRLAGFVWYVIGPYEEDEVRARFVPHPPGSTAWDFDVTIMPRYRMGRLFTYLWAQASADLAARGVRSTLSRISAFNAASVTAHRRLGARTVGEALFVCFGPLQIMKASVSPRWHLSWRASQRPELQIGA